MQEEIKMYRSFTTRSCSFISGKAYYDFHITCVYYAQHSIRVDEKSSALVYVRLRVLALVFSLSYYKLHLHCLFKSKENVLSG